MHNEPKDPITPARQPEAEPQAPGAQESEQQKKPEKQEPVQEKKSVWAECYTLLHDLVYILAAVTIFFVFAVRIVSVSGYSMYPTLVDTDYVALLSNVFYHGSSIENGDIVVALAPEFDTEPIVKRVIATAGQTVDIDFQQGIVYVDGVALEEPYINEPTYRDFGDRGVTFPLTVAEGHVFLMGDNRNDSSDSRLAIIGQVDTRCILGKVLFVMVPGYDERYTDSRSFGRIGGVS